MKINKLILAIALGLGVAGYSYADDMYLTGSTAMRGTVYNTLSAANTIFSGTPSITTWGNASASSATYMDFKGTLKGGSGTTTIHCAWSGSEAGILNVASNTVATFSADADDGGTHSGSPVTTTTSTVDLAMADNDQAYSRTPKPLVTGAKVAVITFEWVRNNGVWTGSNITDDEIQQALGSYCPIGVVTGLTNADTSSYVYVSGRDNSSGTRVNAFGNSGFGIFNIPSQIELDGSGNMVQAPDGNYAEDWGFSSGGNLAKSLGGSTVASVDQVNGGTGFSVIAYLGYNDAQTALGTPYNCTLLTYDGVPFSVQAIQEGNYTFWGNEYIYKNGTHQNSSNVPTVQSALVSNIPSFCYPHGTANANGIDMAIMNCTRSGPLSAPGHN